MAKISPVPGFKRDQRGIGQIVFRANGGHMLPRQLFGQLLVMQIQRRRHPQAAVGDHIGAKLLFQLLAHIDGKMGRSQTDFLRGKGQRLLKSVINFSFGGDSLR